MKYCPECGKEVSMYPNPVLELGVTHYYYKCGNNHHWEEVVGRRTDTLNGLFDSVVGTEPSAHTEPFEHNYIKRVRYRS